MKQLYLVRGLKRSGNHAVIHWLQGMRRFAFFNNVVPVKRRLRNNEAMPPAEPWPNWARENLAERRKACLLEGRVRQLFGELRPPVEAVIASLEDHDTDYQPFTQVPDTFKNILIVRHPENLFASRIKKSGQRDSPETYPRDNGVWQQRIVRIWKNHAKEVLGRTSTMPGLVGIYYDAWFSNEAYRRTLSEKLGLNYNEKGFGAQAREGGGSSFGAQAGEAVQDHVLRRSDFLDDAEKALFLEICGDPEVKELGTALAERFSGTSFYTGCAE